MAMMVSGMLLWVTNTWHIAGADLLYLMAANMIGERKRIIAVLDEDGSVLPMLNPRIVRAEGEYRAQEGCLSLEGLREAVRFERIDVEYEDLDLQPRLASFSGRVAQAVQHEVDHCDGVLI